MLVSADVASLASRPLSIVRTTSAAAALTPKLEPGIWGPRPAAIEARGRVSLMVIVGQPLWRKDHLTVATAAGPAESTNVLPYCPAAGQASRLCCYRPAADLHRPCPNDDTRALGGLRVPQQTITNGAGSRSVGPNRASYIQMPLAGGQRFGARASDLTLKTRLCVGRGCARCASVRDMSTSASKTDDHAPGRTARNLPFSLS